MSARYVTVPPGSRLLLARDGDCRAVLAKSRTEADRMTPLIAFTAAGGKRYVLEMSADDVANLHATLKKWFEAKPDEVSEWWDALGGSAFREAP